MNFLKNAFEAGSPAGQTVLRASAAHDRGVRLSVLDQGKGMSDDVLRQIFKASQGMQRETQSIAVGERQTAMFRWLEQLDEEFKVAWKRPPQPYR